MRIHQDLIQFLDYISVSVFFRYKIKFSPPFYSLVAFIDERLQYLFMREVYVISSSSLHMMDDFDSFHSSRSSFAVDAGYPVIHPPFAQLLGIVKPIKNFHVHAMREIMRQDGRVSMLAQWPHDTVWRAKFL